MEILVIKIAVGVISLIMLAAQVQIFKLVEHQKTRNDQNLQILEVLKEIRDIPRSS